MEHADQGARYISEHYGFNFRPTLLGKYPPVYRRRVIYLKNIPRLPQEVICITIGCEILPSTNQKIYNCHKSQALNTKHRKTVFSRQIRLKTPIATKW